MRSERARGFVSVYNSIRRAAKPDKTFLRLLRSILYVCLSSTHRFARHWPPRVLHYTVLHTTFRSIFTASPGVQPLEKSSHRVAENSNSNDGIECLSVVPRLIQSKNILPVNGKTLDQSQECI